jgi:hypothetical protein
MTRNLREIKEFRNRKKKKKKKKGKRPFSLRVSTNSCCAPAVRNFLFFFFSPISVGCGGSLLLDYYYPPTQTLSLVLRRRRQDSVGRLAALRPGSLKNNKNLHTHTSNNPQKVPHYISCVCVCVCVCRLGGGGVETPVQLLFDYIAAMLLFSVLFF